MGAHEPFGNDALDWADQLVEDGNDESFEPKSRGLFRGR